MPDARVPAALQHVTERHQVVAHVRVRVDERVAHARLCGQMHDAVEAVRKERVARGPVSEIDALEREAGASRERLDARLLERDVVVRVEAVDPRHVGAGVEQCARDVHADEAGCTGHEHAAPGARRRGRGHDPGPSRSSARNFACLRKLANAPIAMCAKPAVPSRKPSRST
jgi:hypothetical protein